MSNIFNQEEETINNLRKSLEYIDNFIWPAGAKQVVVTYSENWEIKEVDIVKKQEDKKWKPKEGEYVWAFSNDKVFKNVVRYPHTFFSAFAKLGDVNYQKNLTWDHFVEQNESFETKSSYQIVNY